MRIRGTAFCLFIVILTSCCEGRQRRRGFKSSNKVGCHSESLVLEDEPCNKDTNCRFGGQCRQVTNFQTHDATLRLIVPSHVKPLDLPFLGSRRRHNRRSSVPENPFLENTGQPMECVCALDCRREPSHSGSVCGTNDKTYENECALQEEACRCQTEILLKWRGPCGKSTPSADILDAFADDEAVSTSGDQIKESSGDAEDSCDTLCGFGAVCDPDSEDEPCKCMIECKAQSITYACGTDGRTYTSECQMRQARCRHQTRIETRHEGPCTAEERRARRGRTRSQASRSSGSSRRYSALETSTQSLDDPCQTLNCNGALDDPLCGTDAISYPNECVMRVASCVKDRPIGVKYKGFCQEDFEVPTTNVPSLIPIRRDAVFEGDIPELEDPCREIYCLHNAVCIEHEEYEFMCSCEDICSRDVQDVPTEAVSDDKSLRILAAFLPSPSVFKGDIGVRDIPPLVNSLIKKKLKPDGATSSPRERDASPEVMVIDFTDDLDIDQETWENEVTALPRFNRRGGRRSRRRQNGNPRLRRERGDYRVRRSLSKRDISGTRPLINEVVCGTDGKTYENECQMRKEACYKKARISMAHRGACPILIKEKPEEVLSNTTPGIISTFIPLTTFQPTHTRQDLISVSAIQLHDGDVKVDDVHREDDAKDNGGKDFNEGEDALSSESSNFDEVNLEEDDVKNNGMKNHEEEEEVLPTESSKVGSQKRGRGSGRKRQRNGRKKGRHVRQNVDITDQEKTSSSDMLGVDKDVLVGVDGIASGKMLKNLGVNVNVAKTTSSPDLNRDPFSAERSKEKLETRDEDVSEAYMEALNVENVTDTDAGDDVTSNEIIQTSSSRNQEEKQPQEAASPEEQKERKIKKRQKSSKQFPGTGNDFPASSLGIRDESEPKSKFESLWDEFDTNTIPGARNSSENAGDKNNTTNNFTEGRGSTSVLYDVGGGTPANSSQNISYTAVTWGIALAVIAVIAIVGGTWVCWWRRKNAKDISDPETPPSEPEPSPTESNEPT